jgi:hypothetical protein
VAIRLIRKQTALSNPEIGAAFCTITFSAVTTTVARLNERIKRHRRLRNEAKELEAKPSSVKGDPLTSVAAVDHFLILLLITTKPTNPEPSMRIDGGMGTAPSLTSLPHRMVQCSPTSFVRLRSPTGKVKLSQFVPSSTTADPFEVP